MHLVKFTWRTVNARRQLFYGFTDIVVIEYSQKCGKNNDILLFPCVLVDLPMLYYFENQRDIFFSNFNNWKIIFGIILHT